MDYEKAYKEALERAKEVYHRGYYVSGDIEHIFPELKESEDERMRKDIIYYLQRKQNQGELDAPDWIAWLEKQAASIDVDSILNKVGIQPTYKDGNAWCILYGDNLQDGICGFGDTKEDSLVEFIKELLEEQGKKKSSIRERYDRIKDSEWFKRTHEGMSVSDDEKKSEPQTVTFIDSGTMQVIEKLNEVIGKLGDIYEVLSKPFQFPNRDYTPPQEPWYKTHGVEKVPPVSGKTLSEQL